MPRKYLLALVVSMAALAATAASARAQNQPFLGQIEWVAFNFPPKGWAFCNGQLLSIAQNDALFNLIGTTYGGDGVSNFALPNLQGRVAVHQGPEFTIGQQGGATQAILTVGQLPPHNHGLLASTSQASLNTPKGNVLAAKTRIYRGAGSINTMMAPGSIGVTGGGAPVPTMPPYTTLNCIIAMTGTFPQQN